MAKIWLVLASLFFYAYWNIDYIVLIVVSIVVNFMIGNLLHKTKHHKTEKTPFRKTTLSIGIIFNLGLLGYYKYTDFFIENANVLLNADFPLLNLLLPLAISFFTFQQVAYLVDCYKADTQEYNFLNYCLFVLFFPQLIAGPIVHHREMMPQFFNTENAYLNINNLAKGVFIFSIGLFKKVVIADTFAIWANAGFDSQVALSFFDAWGASLSYTFQLYYDFSGYTDMAIGAALMFNIHLPANFNSPYKALNIQDFWRRWHMTLSRWLKDYVYIPLGGNRLGSFRTYLNLMLTFVLGGLWHGAGWTFILWGSLHGLALVIHRFWQQFQIKLPYFFAWLITFAFINFTWVIFRAEDMQTAMNIFKGMLGFHGFALTQQFLPFIQWIPDWSSFVTIVPAELFISSQTTIAFIIVFAAIAFGTKNSLYMSKYKQQFYIQDSLFVALVLLSAILVPIASTTSIFLYFNF